LCVSELARLGVKVIFARAANDRQAHVLERVGATRAVQVENEMGRRLAVQVLNPVASHLLDFATHFRVVPWNATPAYAGKTLAQANFRKFELNVLGWFAQDTAAKPKLNFAGGDYQIGAQHTLLLVGEEDAIEAFLAQV
jgi:trk system potassium uptake protein TrkA